VSIQQTQIAPAWPAAAKPETRASDADRDAAAGLLNAAFADGRLTAGEHEERLSAAYAARTWHQLHQITADLPAAPGAVAEPALPEVIGGLDPCLLCALLIVCPPVGIALWLRSRHRRPAPLAGHGAPAAGGQRAEDR
jgi:hypothetical protein